VLFAAAIFCAATPRYVFAIHRVTARAGTLSTPRDGALRARAFASFYAAALPRDDTAPLRLCFTDSDAAVSPLLMLPLRSFTPFFYRHFLRRRAMPPVQGARVPRRLF